MNIVADENIPAVAEAFGTLGRVTLVNGRAMSAVQVRDADLLLVRSVTRVDASLLAGSRVRFVGSATIGFDHVDLEYLERRGIGFATAPGSNAVSAAEYVVSALLVLAERTGQPLAGRSVGIVGCGNVGSRVRSRLAALGMQCRVNDPPQQAAGAPGEFVDFATALQADVVTVHVPYTRTGIYATHHLFDAAAFARLQPGAVFLNTSRGAVADNPALLAALTARDDLTVVLDVWEGEPSISLPLLERVALGTPHIAGYSLDGKLRGTEMIYRAACALLEVTPDWDVQGVLPAASPVTLPADAQLSPEAMARAAVPGCYDIRADDRRLRELLTLDASMRAAYFDRLRKQYPVRREFAATPLQFDRLSASQCALLGGLGFVPPAASYLS
jgi:erythronate-4-phosphate dehydrogenase